MAIKKSRIIVTDLQFLRKIVARTIEEYGVFCDLNYIDVSQMTDLSMLFYNTTFNGSVEEWDVSNVKRMYHLFAGSTFNGDISNWNVSKVLEMSYMFADSVFQGDLSRWDVSSVQTMDRMFCESLFNGRIAEWNVSRCRNFSEMFYAGAFCNDVSHWNISSSADMHSFVEAGRSGSFPEPMVYHWLLALKPGPAIGMPSAWRNHFDEHVSVVRGLASSNMEAAVFLQNSWLHKIQAFTLPLECSQVEDFSSCSFV